MTQPATPIPTAPDKPFFASLEELWRGQLDQLGPPASWPPEERAELEPLYRSLKQRLGEAL